MQTAVIDIHPFDMGDILNNDAAPEVIMWRETLVEHRGQFYRQTIDAPIKSQYAKELAKKLSL